MLVAGQHGKLQMQMQLVALQGIVHDLALLKQLALPQIDQLLAEVRPHRVAEDLGARSNRVGLSAAPNSRSVCLLTSMIRISLMQRSTNSG